jgi:hypothetical protein
MPAVALAYGWWALAGLLVIGLIIWVVRAVLKGARTVVEDVTKERVKRFFTANGLGGEAW